MSGLVLELWQKMKLHQLLLHLRNQMRKRTKLLHQREASLLVTWSRLLPRSLFWEGQKRNRILSVLLLRYCLGRKLRMKSQRHNLSFPLGSLNVPKKKAQQNLCSTSALLNHRRKKLSRQSQLFHLGPKPILQVSRISFVFSCLSPSDGTSEVISYRICRSCWVHVLEL